MKRNAHGAGSIRQRPDGRWEARYTIGRNPATGKQIQRSVYGDTQKEVLAKLQQINVEIEQGLFTEPSKMRLREWLRIWIDEYTLNIKDATRLKYRQICSYRIIPALGNIKLPEIKPHMIQNFYNQALKGTKEQEPIGAKTVKNLHGVLNKSLNQALALGYIRVNPANMVNLPRVEKKEIDTLSSNDIKTFLQAAKDNRFENIYKLALLSGMRQGEILGLTWSCVDFDNGVITVKQQLQRLQGNYRLVSVKNDKVRTITPAPFVIELLRQHRAKQNEFKLTAGNSWDNKLNLVFTDELGRYHPKEGVYRNFKKIVAEIGKPYIRFHDLRHTFAVTSLRAGDDLKIVQSNLGHSSASFTMDTYLHATNEMKKDSSMRMQKFIDNLETV